MFGVLVVVTIILVILYVRHRIKGKGWDDQKRGEGKTFIITGANSGIGRALTELLVERGATVVMVCRSIKRAEDARKDMAQNGIDITRISIEIIDLSDLSSIPKFVDTISKKYEKIAALVCNAGGFAGQELTVDGIESDLQINYLGHFLLTELFLRRSDIHIDRYINVSSLVQKIPWSFNLTDTISLPFLPYCRAKLAQVLHSRALSLHGFTAYSCNPGGVDTNILSDTSFNWLNTVFSTSMRWLLKSPRQGAQTAFMLCLTEKENLRSGAYYSDCAPDRMNGIALSDDFCESVYTESKSLVSKFLP